MSNGFQGFQTFTFDGQTYTSETAALRSQSKALLEALEEERGKLAALHEEPLGIFTICAMNGPGRGVVAGGTPIEINVPEGCKVGSQVRAVGGSKQGFSLLPEPIVFGSAGEVLQVLDPSLVMVKVGPSEIAVVLADGLEAKAGDRVLLCNSNQVALRSLQAAGAYAAPAQKVSWDDIGGQDEAREALREAIEYPTRYAEIYAAHGQKPAKGVMLYGPPGTGKTLLAKALATSIGGDTAGFIYVKSTEVMTKWQGESGATVRALFQRGRAYQAATGKRAVLFVDEADALLPVRDGGGVKISGGAEDMVPVFLNEMDGLDELGPFVLLATNRPDRIDPAVLRDGRCDAKVFVKRPDQRACEDIFQLALRDRRRALSDPPIAVKAAAMLFSERLILLELTYPGVRTSEYVRLRDLVSGAMIEGIVQRAATLAIKRDRESGQLSSIGPDDIEEAIKLTLRQQVGENHDAVIRDISKAFGKLPEKVRKVIDG